MRRSISGTTAGVVSAVFILCTAAAPGVGAEGTPVVGPPPDQQAVSWTGPTLSVTDFADHYFVTVNVDIPYWATHTGGLEVRIKPDLETENLDLYVYQGRWEKTRFGPSVGPIAKGDSEIPGEEVAFVDRAVGEYTIRVVHKGLIPSAYEGLAVFTSRAGRDDSASFNQADTLTFEPASIVSAHFLGPEPMVTMERPVAPFEQATDPDRIFVDWPLSPAERIGQLSRSEDGGDSFRLLFDPDCARFSRPTCVAEGGSDTHVEVNPTTGMLYFSAQVLVAGESFSVSSDHGDTFPETHQQSQVNTATGSDRQWVAPAGDGFDTAKGRVKAFFAYHVPLVSQFIHGVDSTGKVLPQPAAQIMNVTQSGPLRVDTTDGLGHGWIYQPYQGFSDDQRSTEIRVATAPAAEYSSPTAWERSTVAARTPVIFPWLDLDSEGNAYMVWVDDVTNKLVYSVSPIADARNNPKRQPVAGRPGTYWTDPLVISAPAVGTAIFPEVVGGGPGRFGITYMGTEDYQGPPDSAPATTRWHSYGAVVADALAEQGSPVVTTGKVSHRVAHVGSICTGGLAGCNETNEDFSLADMIDLGVDADGRLGVVFADNNSSFAAPLPGQTVKQRPFDHFAKQSSGPELFTGAPLPTRPARTSGVDPAGDATWPNIASGRSFPSLDATDARLSLEGDDLVARIPLRSTGFGADLAAFNSVPSSNPPADRLQYVLRYLTDDEIYHLSMEWSVRGTKRFFGGLLDENDRLLDDETVRGAGYHTDAEMPVRGSVENGLLVLRGKASDFGIAEGTDVYSVTALTMAGPSEARETTIFDTMRTVDATPPFDATLTRITTPPTGSGTTTGTVGPTSGGPSTGSPSTTSPIQGSTSGSGTPPPTTGTPVADLAGSPVESRGRVHSTATLTVIALDSEGNPVPGASVEWSSAGVGGLGKTEAITDELGRVEAVVSSNAPGTQTVAAAASPCAAGADCSATMVRNYGPRICGVFGTSGDDVIEASTRRDVICGFAGNDVIFASGGRDLVLGGRGNDRLYGNDGADRVLGNGGSDEIRGGIGDDMLIGGGGLDVMFGGRGRDSCRALIGERRSSCRL